MEAKKKKEGLFQSGVTMSKCPNFFTFLAGQLNGGQI